MTTLEKLVIALPKTSSPAPAKLLQSRTLGQIVFLPFSSSSSIMQPKLDVSEILVFQPIEMAGDLDAT
jgi:hypothetical protein